ncbi:hypothetical protein L5515_015901 [Caenorhabditis briggsae]|uniref:Uncharacterized protein n=1 Tax=Caenorhabditis briggsae TaxID=6238 RepID=A0AAE9DNY0_CAEBR|nr:hypothetical protein L3Y34_019811 [Caenorhabditis briggsae]UMM20739.1 hypothetical protein L5515_015901 [Caenorhabditis briggsae]
MTDRKMIFHIWNRLRNQPKYERLEDPCLRRNSLNTDGYYGDLEKMHEHGLFTTGVNYNAEKSEDFLNLIERMQSNRLDDQRCDLPERVRGFSES